MGSKCKDSSSCDLCNVDLSSIQEQLEHDYSLIHHMKLHQKQKNQLHSCSLCSRDVGTIKSYVSHLHGSKHQEFLTSQRKYWQEKPPTRADLKHRRHVVKIDSERSKSKQSPIDKPSVALKNSGNNSRWDRPQPRNVSPSSNVGPQNFQEHNRQSRNLKHSNFNAPVLPGRMGRTNTFPRQPYNPEYDRNHPNYSHYNNNSRNYQNPYSYQRNRPPWFENQPNNFYQDWEGNFHNQKQNTNPNYWNCQPGGSNTSYQDWDKQPGGFWIDSSGDREVNAARPGKHTIWKSNEEFCNDANNSKPQVNKLIETPIDKDVPSDTNSNVVANFLTKMRNESDESKKKKNTKKGNKKGTKTSSKHESKLKTVKTPLRAETEPNTNECSVDSAAGSFFKNIPADGDKVELCGQKVKNLNIHLSPEKLDRKVFLENILKIEPKSTTKKSKSEKLNKKHMFFLSSDDSEMEDEPSDNAKSTSPKNSLNAIGKPRVGAYNTGLLNRLVNFPCTRKQQAQLASWVQEHSKRKKKLILPRFNMSLGQQSSDKEEEDIELRKVLSQMMTDLPDDTIDALVEVLKRDNNETEDQEDLEMILVPQEEEQRESVSEKETRDCKAEQPTKLFNFNFPVPEFHEEEPPMVPETVVPDFQSVVIKRDPDGPSSLSTSDQLNRSPFLPDHQRSDPLPHQVIDRNISPASPHLLPNSPLVMSHNKSSTPRSNTSEDQRNRISPFCQLPNNCSPHQNSPSHVNVMRGNSLLLESEEAVEPPSIYPEEPRNQIQINVTGVPEEATPAQIRDQHATLNKGDHIASPAARKSSKSDNAQLLPGEENNCNNQMKKHQSEALQESNDTIDAQSCMADDETECLSNFTFNNSDLEYSHVQEPNKNQKSNSFNFQQAQKSSASFKFQKPQDNDNFHNPSPFMNNPDTTNLSHDDNKCLSPQMSSAAPSNWSEFPSWIKRPSPDPSPSGRRSTGSTKDLNMASGSTGTTGVAAHSIVDQLLQLSKEEEDLRARSLRIDEIIIDMYKVLEEWKQKRAQLQQEEVQMRNTRLNLLQVLQGSLSKDAPDNGMIFSPPEVSSSNSKVGACSSTTPEGEPQNVTYLGTLDSTWQLIQELGLNMSDEVINSTMPNSEENTGDLINNFLNPSGSKKKAKNIIKNPAKKKVAKKSNKKTPKVTGDTRNRKRKNDVLSELSDKDSTADKKRKKRDNAKIQANILQDLLNHLVKKEVETLRASENRELDQRQTAKAPETPSSDLSDDSEDRIDTPPFETFAPLEAHDSAILDIKVSNGFVYTCSVDKTAKRFEIANPENSCVYADHQKTVSAIQVVASEKGHDQLFTTSHDCYLRCFDSQSGKLLSEHFTGSSILCIAKGWGKLYLGLNNGEVWPYVIKTSKFLDKLAFSQSSVTKIATGKEGMQRLLCVVTYDGRISVRNADTGLLIRLLETIVRPPCCLLIDGSEVFTTTTDRTILVHDLSSGKLLKSAACDSSATSLHLVGDYVVSCSFDGFIRYYQRKTWVLHKMYYGAGKCMTMCMDISNGWVYSGNRHGIIEGFNSDHQTNALCSYQNCRNPFGTWEDLHHHINADHLKNLSAKTVLSYKFCPWRNCDFLVTGTSAQAKLKVFQDHILQHAIST